MYYNKNVEIKKGENMKNTKTIYETIIGNIEKRQDIIDAINEVQDKNRNICWIEQAAYLSKEAKRNDERILTIVNKYTQEQINEILNDQQCGYSSGFGYFINNTAKWDTLEITFKNAKDLIKQLNEIKDKETLIKPLHGNERILDIYAVFLRQLKEMN